MHNGVDTTKRDGEFGRIRNIAYNKLESFREFLEAIRKVVVNDDVVALTP